MQSSTAVDMFLRQISRTKKVPLKLELDDYGCPDSVNVAKMTQAEFERSLGEALEDVRASRVMDFAEFDRNFRTEHGITQDA